MSTGRAQITPRPRGGAVQQPMLLANLNTTTLAPALPAPPFTPWIAPMPVRTAPRVLVLQYPNLGTSTLAPAVVVNPFQPQLPALPTRRAKITVVEYQNLNTNLLAQDLYFLNDSGFVPQVRATLRIQQLPNLQMSTLAPAAAQAPFTPAYLPTPAVRRATIQPQLQSGLIQLLSITAPLNQLYWPMPVRAVPRAQPLTTQNLALITPAASDATPDQFTFIDMTGIGRDALTYSNTVTLTGFNTTVAISVTGGEYSKNAGTYTSSAGTAESGDTITVDVLSSSAYATAASVTFTAGGISNTFTATTGIAPQEVIPYLIGEEEYSARRMLESIYMVVSVVGSGGTVTAQSVAAFSLADRGTTVEITMGGTTYIPPRAGRGGTPPYGSGIQ